MEKNKKLEYYLDGRISGEELQKNIARTKKQFPNKKIEVRIALNEYGMYVINFKFENKKTFLNKIVRLKKKTKMYHI